MFVEGGQTFRSIDEMVDRIFNRFIRREGHLEPFFAEYCDGRRTQCPGLWQWSTVTLAQQGLNALQILRRFYPNDIQIVETDNIGGVQESFPGFTLRPGMSGPEVRTMQNWLNRIRVNFPIIPQITVNGVYGPQTEAAVRAFQGIHSLGSVSPSGVVDRATWWNLSRAYSAVKRLGELTSEGIVIGIGRTPPTDIIRQGARGNLVGRAQYMMNFISQFYPSVPSVVQDFNFGANFSAAVREFQRLFGLNPDGVIGPLTWRMLYSVYWRIRDNVSLPPGEPVEPPIPPGPPPGPGGIPPYPGQLIRVGARGDDVRRIQQCLNAVNNAGLTTDGIFGPLTQIAVMSFQRSRGLNPDGVVGPLTWGALMPTCYGGGQAMGAYPGFLIREGARGDYVRQIQTCLNRVNNAGLNTDGIFGPLTRTAVVNYQSANGLTADGIVGPITWNHLQNRCGGASAAGMIAPQTARVANEPNADELVNFLPLEFSDETIEVIPAETSDETTDTDPIEMTESIECLVPFPDEPAPMPQAKEPGEWIPPQIIPVPWAKEPPSIPPVEEPHVLPPIMPLPEMMPPPVEELPEPLPAAPSHKEPRPQQVNSNDLLVCLVICCLCRRW